MSEFLKSAFDYFGNTAKSKGNNELIGNSIEIGNQTFKVINTIAEGGFSIVFEAQDVKTHKMYALKRLISHDNETNKEIMQEINYLKKLSGHLNIIHLCTAASIGQQKQGHVGTDFLIVTELCTGGQVIQLMQRRNKHFPHNVTLQIFHQVCQAVAHMHSQSPPIIHRDLKVENLLISNRAVIKLCDFGSATTEPKCPDNSWTGSKRNEIQEEIEKHTTPMYRTPEMLDLYQNYPINQAGDIWALGCVLFYFCCNKHPFEDSAKLAILNANYTIPQNIEINDSICGLIYQMLLIDPRQRLNIVEIINEIRLQASTLNIPLRQSIIFDKESLVHLPPLNLIPEAGDAPVSKTALNKNVPGRPQPPVPKNMQNTPVKVTPKVPTRPNLVSPSAPEVHTTIPTKAPISTPVHNQNDGKKVLGLLKDGAGSIMKNIRDVSNKVMEQVSSSMNKTDLDLTYVTSRIIMMPTPAEAGIDLLTKDKVDDVQVFLDFRHPNQYFVYNLGLKLMTSDKLKDRVLHLGFDPLKPPPLNNLVMLCMHQLNWLLQDPKNVIVVQCADGRVASGINIAALFCFCRLVDTSSSAADIVRFRRGSCPFSPSQLRYADYLCRLMRGIADPNVGPDIPHNYVVKITGIELQPVPLFNRAKTGVRPFVEIFNDYKLVHSTMTNYEDLALFTIDNDSIHIPIPNVCVHGDLNIVVYHTRSNIVAKGKISAIKVCETQVYTGYLQPTCTEIALMKSQLDNCDTEEEKYPTGFNLKIKLHVTNKDSISFNQVQTLTWNSEKFKKEILDRMPKDDRMVPFNSREEMQSCIISSGVKLPMKEPKPKQPVLPNNPKTTETKEDFFFTLDWTKEENNEVKNESVHSSPALSESPVNNFSSNNNDVGDQQFGKSESIEAVGDLLGDFGTHEYSIPIDQPPVQQVFTNDVDGLADFFSTFSAPNDDHIKSGSNSDFLAAFTDTDTKNEQNLLFFESSHSNDKGNSFMFDPFEQNLTNSSSTKDLSSYPSSRPNDWGFGDSDPISSHQNPPLIKPSNSTNCLLNLNSTSQMKTSPSFNGTPQPQKTDSFGNFNDIFSKPASSSSHTKPTPPPKPKIEPKVFEKAENVPPKNKKDAFQDLLGDFKPSESKNGSANNGARSIKDIRKETMSRTTDPEELMVLDWVEGREKNIRALLCALPSILWSEVRWSGVNMSELVTVDQVKRAYKNAIRCVHPDKWNHSEHENMAKMIMMELNEAMTEFEAEKNASK